MPALGLKRLRRVLHHVTVSADSDAAVTHWQPGATLEHRVLSESRAPQDLDVEVAIIGGGLAGIICAVKLIDAGFKSFIIFEKGSDLGGTWYWNQYPGCACDISAYGYLPYLQRLGVVPPNKYVSSAEIRAHLHRIADHFGLRKHAVLATKVSSVVLNEVAPNKPRWSLRTDRGDSCSATFVICAVGLLSTPKLPEVEGMQRFKGLSRHTSHWQAADIDRCRNQRVAVVGTGSSSVQIVPELAAIAKHLYVIQRTAAWVLPRVDEPTSQEMRLQLLDEKGSQAQRWEVSDNIDEYNVNIQSDEMNKELQTQLSSYIKAIVKDQNIALALIPDYPVGCKRVCLADNYYPVFNRSNVTLVAHRGGVRQVTETGVLLKDGSTLEADVLVFATGFDAFSGAFSTFSVCGRGGESLSDYWSDGPKCLYGVHPGPGFPNFMCLNGPQSPGIIANVTEAVHRQTDHVIEVLTKLQHHNSKQVAARKDAVDRYATKTDSMFPGSVFAKCNSWYNRPRDGSDAPRLEGWVGSFREYLRQFSNDDLDFS